MKKRKSSRIIDRSVLESLNQRYAESLALSNLEEEIKTLGPSSYNNRIKLLKIGIGILKELTNIKNEATRIRQALQKAVALNVPVKTIHSAILDHVAAQLAQYHLEQAQSEHNLKASEISLIFQNKMQEFQVLITTLWNHDVDVTRLFNIVLSDVRVLHLPSWCRWYKLYNCWREKAVTHRRKLILVRNVTASILPPALQRAIETQCNQFCTSLDELIHEPNIMKDKHIFHSTGNLRSNSSVWTPVLKKLHQELRPHFQPIKHWEAPGGFPGGAVTAKKVFEIIGMVLHFSFPFIWPHNNSNIVMTIKTRCLR